MQQSNNGGGDDAAVAAAASIVSWPLRLVVKKKKGTCMVVHVKAIRCFS